MSIWPVVLGALLIWSALFLTRRLRLDPRRFQVAAGDLLVLVEWALGRVRRRLSGQEGGVPTDPVVSLASR